MVAISYPSPTVRRPELRLVTSTTAGRRLPATTYRRRRLLVAALALVVTLSLLASVRAATGSGAAAVATTPGSSVVVRDLAAYGAGGIDLPSGAVYVVQPGDTLWSIAGRLDPGGDVRDAVDQLAARNGGAAVVPGQRLLIG